MKDHRGNISFALAIGLGLILILVFLTLLYLGKIEGPKIFGLFGEKKQQEQPTEAKVAPTISSIKLNETDPHLGGTITFTTTSPKSVKSPRIAVRCFQNEEMTYAEAGTYNHAFLLGGGWSKWLEVGGPASCTAELFYFIWHGSNPQEYYHLAWTSFAAAGQ